MKKTGILNREISALVASMGHRDFLIVADAGLPILEDIYRLRDICEYKTGNQTFCNVFPANSSWVPQKALVFWGAFYNDLRLKANEPAMVSGGKRQIPSRLNGPEQRSSSALLLLVSMGYTHSYTLCDINPKLEEKATKKVIFVFLIAALLLASLAGCAQKTPVLKSQIFYISSEGWQGCQPGLGICQAWGACKYYWKGW